jgi:aminopeptidase N
MKTIQYKAENVHDFAWFADKRFYVQKEDVTLPSGRKVDTYVMFTYYEADLWKEAILYVNRSVEYYSDRIGEYPYPHATAVQSALSAGAGMEYPMITVIGGSGNGKSLDQVITHEVGHNWFYGILASNERQFVWMDEGFNSFYEQAYIKKYYHLIKF